LRDALPPKKLIFWDSGGGDFANIDDGLEQCCGGGEKGGGGGFNARGVNLERSMEARHPPKTMTAQKIKATSEKVVNTFKSVMIRNRTEKRPKK
jgi:hypothetical protein